jgi:uncharacterized 2Fe-2S/4Fe-4S cluster protein (DUF4445 family)
VTALPGTGPDAAAPVRRTLFDDASDLAVQMPASCRRSGRCHECIVEVLAGADALGEPTDAESFLRPPFRLACQAVVVRTDAVVDFRPLRRRLRILVDADAAAMPDAIDSPVRRTPDGVTLDGAWVDLDRGRAMGLAIDVGTTTVVVELVDLESGRVEGVAAIENPQVFGGSDVMNRISYDERAPGKLRRALTRALNVEIRGLCAAAGVDRRVVYEACVVGNSTMRDIFFGVDVASIGQRPYKSAIELAWLEGRRDTTVLRERAHHLGLWMHPRGFVESGPLVASHLGADIAADLAALDVDALQGNWMVVDIGTNTEVVVSDGSRILAASCPAGPAFEGGLVRYGMPGAAGAIERVRRAGGDGWEFEVIGGVPAEGICGSGLIDLLAELRRGGWMTPKGVFRDREQEIIIDPVRGITLSREDAANLAQAKAANACGQAILLRHLGLSPRDLDAVFLAGGFANHVDVESAIEIGFLANVRPDRVRKVGNASLRGARRLLLSSARRAELETLVRRIEHVELETTPDFFELFVDACQFKPLEAA